MSDAFATFGRVRNAFGTVIVLLVAVCLSCVGCLMIYKNQTGKQFIQVPAKLSNVKCYTQNNNTSQGSAPPVTTCAATATYFVGTVAHVNTITLRSVHLDGDTVYVYYDPDNPDNVQISPSLPWWAGYAVICGAMIMALIAGVWAYAVQSSNAVASFSGISSFM